MYMPEVFSEIFGIGSIIEIIFSLVFSFIPYILTAIAVFTMAKKLNLRHAWFAFLPFCDVYLLGKVAEQNKKTKVKYSILLLVLNIVFLVVYLALFVLFLIFMFQLIGDVELAVELEEALTPQMFELLIPLVIFAIMTFVMAILYITFYFIALSHVYSIFDDKNNVLFIILSILFTALIPVFLLIESTKQVIKEEEIVIPEIPESVEIIEAEEVVESEEDIQPQTEE